MEETIGKAKLRDAAIGTGIAVDKMLALTGQTPAGQIAVVLPTHEEEAERRARHARLDAITAKLAAIESSKTRKARPRGRGLRRSVRAAAQHWACTNGVVVQVDRACAPIGPSQTIRVATWPLCGGKDMSDLLPSTAYFFQGSLRSRIATTMPVWRESLAEFFRTFLFD